jgi:hypothetical protein
MTPLLWATDFRRPFGPESRASKADSDLADESHRSTEGPNYERMCTDGSVVASGSAQQVVSPSTPGLVLNEGTLASLIDALDPG